MVEHLLRAKTLLEKHDLSFAIIQSPPDLLYCTGLNLSHGTLLVGKEESFLFLDGRYYELAKNLPLNVVLIEEPQDLLTNLQRICADIEDRVGFNPHTMTVATHEKIAGCFQNKEVLAPVSSYYALLRRKKTPEEIEVLSRACALCEKGLAYLLGEILPGVSENKLASLLKVFWFQHGAEAISFEPIIAFDKNTSIPHWRHSLSTLGDKGTILIDIGVEVDSYQSDMTRVAFYGEPDEELMKCFSIIKGAYEKAFSFAAQGVTPHHLDSVARTYIKEKGYGSYFSHGLGHGVGLEVHEPPKVSYVAQGEAPLEVGDVFTIEPGIYLPGRGGVRLENTVVLEEGGARSLFTFPTEPILLP